MKFFQNRSTHVQHRRRGHLHRSRHREIINLHMSAMTMMFGVKEKTMLEKLRVGDKVKFKAVERSGSLKIIEIKKQ